jgi:hypothetical protein
VQELVPADGAVPAGGGLVHGRACKVRLCRVKVAEQDLDDGEVPPGLAGPGDVPAAAHAGHRMLGERARRFGPARGDFGQGLAVEGERDAAQFAELAADRFGTLEARPGACQVVAPAQCVFLLGQGERLAVPVTQPAEGRARLS